MTRGVASRRGSGILIHAVRLARVDSEPNESSQTRCSAPSPSTPLPYLRLTRITPFFPITLTGSFTRLPQEDNQYA